MYTTDPKHPKLGHGVDEEPTPQNEFYLVLSDAERAKGFTRPLRHTYIHQVCGTPTTMTLTLSETYARDPHFYSATYCCHCQMHRPVGEFLWLDDGQTVGS